MHPLLLTVLVPATLLAAFPVQEDEEGLAGLGQSNPTRVAREAAEQALSEGRHADANRHAQRALESDPFDRELLLLALRSTPGDEDARRLYSHAWFDATTDAEGRAKVGQAKDLLSDSEQPARIATLRAAAVSELKGFASDAAKSGRRRADELLVANWARRVGRELAEQSPSLDKAQRAALEPQHTVDESFHEGVLDAIEKLMDKALSSGDTGLAMRAARSLHGLAVQGDFKDLEGPRPSGMGRVRAAAGKGLGRARAKLLEEVGAPWTIDDLEWLTTEEGEAFTRSHKSFALPGVALSPQAWYRVETDCGFETLLGVSDTIEQHHERLAGWYGEDPFVGRPGTVRIVPEASGLEAEGAPFWWAGGFQGGDTTVMRFAQGNIEGLGHGLTHELTHRFDGAIYPGQPSWLTEGKAVWTASAYGHSSDKEFVENHVSFGTIEGVFIDGWSHSGKLRQLITGTLDDYRDNYSVGYSLYVYLNTWEEGGQRPFQDRLQRFMEEGDETGLDALAFFEECFCDGQSGRPEDYDEFAVGWSTFLQGFYWKSRADWTSRYTAKVPPAGDQPWVYDEPTWTWQRHRSEPHFGQDQARVAGKLLLDAGRQADAVLALVWSVAVDGREPRAFRWMAAVLPQMKRPRAAWVAEHSLAFPLWPVGAPAPFLDDLPRLEALLEGLAEAAQEARDAGHTQSAAALTADHDRLARWVGAPELISAGDLAVDPDLRHPFDRGARPLGAAGWEEDRLVGYDKKRNKGLWYAAENGDLFVGRSAPRSGTGQFDRGGGGMCFARSVDYQLPGTYRIKTRVQFTTAHASGAVVFGYQRRDLAMQFSFSGGDYMYAIGEEDEEPSFEAIGWGLSGMWERDGALGGSTRGGGYNFEKPSVTFDLELLIDGASVQAFINGDRVGTYHTADGRPIEGQVGFATSRGAIRLQRPLVERLDRSRLARRGALEPEGLDLRRGVSPPFDRLENRPVHGLEPASNGTLLLWVGMPYQHGTSDSAEYSEADIKRRALSGARRVANAANGDGLTQSVVVALPGAMDRDLRAELEAELSELFPDESVTFRILDHPFDGRPTGEGFESPDLNKRWLMFVDAAGVIRVCQPYVAVGASFEGNLGHWLTVFREHGEPTRNMPQVLRKSELEEEDDE